MMTNLNPPYPRGRKEELTFEPGVLVKHIDMFGKGLSEWDVNFIADMIDNPPEYCSPKQVKIIKRIYDEKT